MVWILECCCVRSENKETQVVGSPKPEIPFTAAESINSVSSPRLHRCSSADEGSTTQDDARDVHGGQLGVSIEKDRNVGLRRKTFLADRLKLGDITEKSETLTLDGHDAEVSFREVAPKEKFKAASKFLMTISGKRGMRKSQVISDDDIQKIHLEQKQWLEALDKGHRAGGDLKEFYKAWEKSDTTAGFFDWLDSGDSQKDLPTCPRRQLDSGKVKYCSMEERQKYLVEVVDGILRYKQSGEVASGNLIFVMGVKGHLYMAKKTKGRFQHSSFLAGNPVLVAGSVHMEDGRFVKLMPYSGHYKPQPEHFGEFLKRMREKGLAAEQCSFLEDEVNNPAFFDKKLRGK